MRARKLNGTSAEPGGRRLESDTMLQILISLGILALWALTSLLSREAQPLPPRTVRARPGEAPRPAASFRSNRAGPPTTSCAETATASSRAADQAPPSRSPSGLAPLSNDEIRLLESDPRFARSLSNSSVSISPAGGTARGSRIPARRGSRTRSVASTSPARPAEPEAPRQLSSQINQSMAQAVNRPLAITPLDIPLTSLSSSLTPLGTRVIGEPSTFHEVGPSLDGRIDPGGLLGSPEKLREIAILTEVLKPPLRSALEAPDSLSSPVCTVLPAPVPACPEPRLKLPPARRPM